MWGFDVWTIITSTSRRKFEAIDGEWKILIIWIIDKESVVNGFLETLGFIAFWNQWASGSRCCALLNSCSLCQGFVMSLDCVNNDSPFSMNINGTKRLDVGGF